MDAARLADLRPRRVWDLADDAFDVYRERFALLAGLAAVPLVPAYLLNTLVTAQAYQRLQAAQSASDSGGAFVSSMIFAGAAVADQPILLAAQAVQVAATALAVDRILSGNFERTWSGGDIWKRTRGTVVSVAFGGFLSSLAILTAAAITLGVGGLIVAALVALLPICQALERLPLGAALRRSYRIVVAHFWRILGVLALLYALDLGLQTGLSALLQIVFALLPGGLTGEGASSAFVGAQAAGAVAALFLAPLKAVALTLAYFDCRVRTEGLDIIAMAKNSGVALAEDPR